MPLPIVLFFTGLAAGVMGGYLGIGGGVIMVPVLVELLQNEGVDSGHLFHLAFGTALCAAIGTAAATTASYARAHRVAWKAILWAALPAVVMSLIGSYLAAISKTGLLRTAFSVFVITSAVLLIRGKFAPPDGSVPVRHIALVVTGCLAGIASAYLGIAGGVIMVPLFLIWARLPVEYGPGTSAAVGIVTTCVGALGYVLHGMQATGLPSGAVGFVLPGFAAPLMIGTILGAPLGTYLNRQFGTKVFRYIFAVFLLFIAARLLLRSL
ncbi:MAG: sulfite exporter TauE/SafE family protein [bacterium]